MSQVASLITSRSIFFIYSQMLSITYLTLYIILLSFSISSLLATYSRYSYYFYYFLSLAQSTTYAKIQFACNSKSTSAYIHLLLSFINSLISSRGSSTLISLKRPYSPIVSLKKTTLISIRSSLQLLYAFRISY